MKRQLIPKTWPIAKKGTAYVIKGNGKSVPVLVAIRDMLKLAVNRKEVKKALNSKNILINNKVVKDEKNVISLFDILTIVPAKKSYSLELTEKGKFEFVETKDSKSKVSKVVGKKSLKGKKTQINLYDGKNYLYDKEVKVGDSVVIDLEKNVVSKILPLKEKARVVVFDGKHIGEKGTIEKVKEERKMVIVSEKEKKANILIKQVMVIQ
jgi:small subunit ribosomal protein S4e